MNIKHLTDFERLRNDYQALDADTLKRRANDDIGVSLSLNDQDRRKAIEDWFNSYSKIMKMKKGERGVAGESEYMSGNDIRK